MWSISARITLLTARLDVLGIVDGSGGRPVEGRGDVSRLPPGPPHPVHIQDQGLPHSET